MVQTRPVSGICARAMPMNGVGSFRTKFLDDLYVSALELMVQL